jgi:hypothetical protein
LELIFVCCSKQILKVFFLLLVFVKFSYCCFLDAEKAISGVLQELYSLFSGEKAHSAPNALFDVLRATPELIICAEAVDYVGLLQYALWKLQYFDGTIDGFFSEDLKNSILLYKSTNNIAHSDLLLSSETISRLFSHVKFKKSPLSGRAEDEEKSVFVTKKLFLRLKKRSVSQYDSDEYSECRVHFAELDPALSVVIVANNTEEANEAEKLKRVNGYLRSRKSLGIYC